MSSGLLECLEAIGRLGHERPSRALESPAGGLVLIRLIIATAIRESPEEPVGTPQAAAPAGGAPGWSL
jgi:hypothetical protein